MVGIGNSYRCAVRGLLVWIAGSQYFFLAKEWLRRHSDCNCCDKKFKQFDWLVKHVSKRGFGGKAERIVERFEVKRYFDAPYWQPLLKLIMPLATW